MGAAFVTTRNKIGIAGADFFKGFSNVLAFGFGRVSGRANQHKVVVHHGKTLDGKTLGHGFFFCCLVMHKQHIGIAPATHVDGLARTHSNNFHVNACGFFKLGQKRCKQPGLLGRGGGSHHDGV